MTGHDVIVVGGSAGSLAPLISLLKGLPPSFEPCLLVVLHGSSERASNLHWILGRATSLPVSLAVDGQRIGPGIIVAAPDRHLIVEPGHIRVTHGPKENGFRPAIDPLFRTAARAYGRRVVGVVLSGGLDDGAYGLREIKANGGLAIVQDPEDAEISNMPSNAIHHVDVDYVLPATAIAPLLCRESRLPPRGDVVMAQDDSPEPQLPGVKIDIAQMNADLGPPSGLTCPDCGGALWQVREGHLVRFQCHVGHHYSPESLLMQQDNQVEAAMWTAVRALEERAELRRRMATQTEAAGLTTVSESFADQALEAERHADEIRAVLAGAGESRIASSEPAGVSQRRKRPRQR